MPHTALIRVCDVTARYGDETVLEHVSFEIGSGEIVALLGASGCGKTTLLRHMVRLNKPHAGRILIDGEDINSNDERIMRQALQKIGILFQGSALLGSMTVADNIALPILKYTRLSKQAVRHLVRIKLRQVNLAG